MKMLIEKNRSFPILGDTASQIPSIAFDSPSRTLFWTNQREIMKMRVPLNDVPGKPQILHKLEDKSPRGIALDTCNRFVTFLVVELIIIALYSWWSNENKKHWKIKNTSLRAFFAHVKYSHLYNTVQEWIRGAIVLLIINSLLYTSLIALMPLTRRLNKFSHRQSV